MREYERLIRGGVENFFLSRRADENFSSGGSESLNVSSERMRRFTFSSDEQMRTSCRGGSENLNISSEKMRKFI